MEEKKDKIFTAMEEEDKPKISPLVTSKSYMEYLKKLPLKFIIPLILVAAVALSASFIFHKSTSTNTTPQNMTSAIQPAKNKTDIEPEEIVIEKAAEEKQPQANPPAQEPSIESPSQEPIETEGEVKTKVNEVFAVKEIQPQIPDVENVNLEEDVLSETAESTPEPILPQELPAKPPEDNPESANLPSGDSDTELTPLGIPGSTPEEDQPAEESQTSDDEIPVETGDLIPFRKVDIKPEIAKKVDPEYPILAYNRGVEGKVVINVLISETGDVIETALIKGIVGPYGFNEECDNAVRQWKFVPAFKDGVKVKVWKTISFTFKKS
jgi:TonB family protein